MDILYCGDRAQLCSFAQNILTMQVSTENNLIILKSFDSETINLFLQSTKSYSHPDVCVAPSVSVPGQHALVAQQNIPAGAVIFSFTNLVSGNRTRTSIQVGESMHIEAGDFGSFTNHSCDPNAIIRAVNLDGNSTVGLFAFRAIEAGEELSFDYATTESDLTEDLQKVPCLCGAPTCRGKVYSFPQLDAKEKLALLEAGLCAEHIEQMASQLVIR